MLHTIRLLLTWDLLSNNQPTGSDIKIDMWIYIRNFVRSEFDVERALVINHWKIVYLSFNTPLLRPPFHQQINRNFMINAAQREKKSKKKEKRFQSDQHFLSNIKERHFSFCFYFLWKKKKILKLERHFTSHEWVLFLRSQYSVHLTDDIKKFPFDGKLSGEGKHIVFVHSSYAHIE